MSLGSNQKIVRDSDVPSPFGFDPVEIVLACGSEQEVLARRSYVTLVDGDERQTREVLDLIISGMVKFTRPDDPEGFDLGGVPVRLYLDLESAMGLALMLTELLDTDLEKTEEVTDESLATWLGEDNQ
jgi:hypothetical protein